jgi:DNA polymerase III delta prime subunit
MNWLTKYKPKSVDEIIGNEEIIQEMRDWFQKYRSKDPKLKRGIILCGPPGTGKTLCAELISKECGFLVHEFNASDSRSKKTLQATMSELAQSRDVMEFFTKREKPRPHVIIMEEIDGMSTGDYGGMGEVESILNPRKKTVWNAPIICTSNQYHINKLKKLMRHCYVFNFEYPNDEQMLSLLQRIMKNENIKLSKKAQTKIIAKSQRDYRQLINIVETLSKSYSPSEREVTNDSSPLSESVIPDSVVMSGIKMLGDKFISLGLQDAINEIKASLNPSNPMITLTRGIGLYFMDRYILPESIHENYLKWIKEPSPPLQHSDCHAMNAISLAADTFSNRDFTFPLTLAATYSYECQEFVGAYAINLPLGYLKDAPIKNKIPALVHPKQFSTNVIKASQEKIIAYLCSLSSLLIRGNGGEKLIQLKYFIEKWLDQKNFDLIVEKLYAYELLPEHISILLKIKTDYFDDDSITSGSTSKKTKDLFSIKIQREIEELFEDYNEKMYLMHKLPYIQVRHESRRTISFN